MEYLTKVFRITKYCTILIATVIVLSVMALDARAELTFKRMVNPGSTDYEAIAWLKHNGYKVKHNIEENTIRANKGYSLVNLIVAPNATVVEEHLVYKLDKKMISQVKADQKIYLEKNGPPYYSEDTYIVWFDGTQYVALVEFDGFIMYYYSDIDPKISIPGFLE